MVESLSERQMIASQLKEMRALEKSRNYRALDWDRDMNEYLYWFNGLTQLFKYAKGLGKGNLVFDLGAGTTKGISEIAKSRLGEGLRFEASVLTYRPEIEQNLGLDKTHITSAEILRGVEKNSVSAILSLNSLAYSAAPNITVGRINEVLVPGGVLKATFRLKNRSDDKSPGNYNYQTHDKFSAYLRDLNYDVAVSDLVSEEIIVAIKPAAESKRILAKDLLKRDSSTLDIGMRVDGYY